MNTQHKSTNIRLFSPEVIVNNWEHRGKIWNGLPITLFGYREQPIIPYEIGIKDYPAEYAPGYAESALNSYFTQEEVGMIKDFLERNGFYKKYDATFHENEVALPIANDCAPVHAAGVEGYEDILLFHRLECYDLPFKLEGYYDLRSCFKI